MLPAGQVRLGWLYLGLDRTTDAVSMFRAFLAGSGDMRGDREWAEAGLGLALVGTGDIAGARRALAALDARRSPLGLPIRLRLIAHALEKGRSAEALDAIQEVLAGNVSPAVRAWVLVVQGDVHRARGERDRRVPAAVNRESTGTLRGSPGGRSPSSRPLFCSVFA